MTGSYDPAWLAMRADEQEDTARTAAEAARDRAFDHAPLQLDGMALHRRDIPVRAGEQ